ncbi:DUF2567 domain-containing protein [Micromonospora siamensis]|uniref:DUF2567 domain-containing protein n=1 Tax=Micromonospora siamensis TaxID=299152 RepID=A0A1C5JHM3_9ACTN|nr:Protein of unknown function [Micromonospora siamensis]
MSPENSDAERAEAGRAATDPPAASAGAGEAPPWWWQPPPAPAPEPGARRRAVLAGLAAFAALTVLGLPLGLLWAALAPDIPVVKTPEGAVYAQPQPEQPIAADGWFSLLGLGFGVLAGVALWFVLRRRRGPGSLLGGTAGALAAALVAWQVGRRIGLSTYQRLLETAPPGRAFTKPADLRAGGVDWFHGVLPYPHGNLLLPAFGVAVTYTLLAGWSRWPSLRPEPEPFAGAPFGPVPFGAEPSGPGPVGPGGPGPVSSGPAAGWPAPPAAPEPPAPGAAGPSRG